MSSATHPRPAQVTFSGWLTVGGSAVVVLMAFSQVSSLGSLETQDTIRRYLSEPPGDSFGLSVADVQTVLRITSTVAAVCAAATGVLGWFVMQRSRGARIALSVLAVPLLLAGLTSGGFMTAVVAAAALMLWLQPARSWYAGVDPPARPPARPAARPTAPVPPVASSPDELPPPTAPPLYPAPGAGTHVAVAEASSRPAAVVFACVVTWLFTAVAAATLALTAVVTLTDPSLLLDQAHRQNPDLADQGITDAALKTGVYVLAAVVILWSIAVAVVAVLAWRRVRWAMVALLVSAVAAGLLCLVMSLASLAMVVVVLACAATVSLLLRPEVRRWYAAPPSSR